MANPITKNLLQGLIAEDADAARQFIDEYWISCCRYAYVLTSDVHFAEDIAQEAFVKVLRSVHTFDSERPLRPWLFKIIENTKREYYRREKRRKAWEEKGQARAGVQSWRSVENKEQCQLMRQHMAQLSEPFRRALSLRYLDSLPIKDIARELNCPEKTVSTRIHRGLKMLEASLKPVLTISSAALLASLPEIAAADFGEPRKKAILSSASKLGHKGGVIFGQAKLAAVLCLALLLGFSLKTLKPDPLPTTEALSIRSGKQELSSLPSLPRSSKQGELKKRASIQRDQSSAPSRRKLEERDTEGLGNKAGKSVLGLKTAEDGVLLKQFLGRFVSESGEPLKGLEVVILSEQSSYEEALKGHCDSQGYFRIPVSNEQAKQFENGKGIQVSMMNFMCQWGEFSHKKISQSGGFDLGTLTMTMPFAKFRVQVNAGGLAMAKLPLKIERDDLFQRSYQNLGTEGVTDETGQFQFILNPHYDIGKFLVTVQASNYAVIHKSVEFKGADLTVTIDLIPGEQVSGVVLSPEGREVEGARILVLKKDVPGVVARVKTNWEGRFQLQLKEAKNYKLCCYAPEKGALLDVLNVPLKVGVNEQEIKLKRGGIVILEKVKRAPGIEKPDYYSFRLTQLSPRKKIVYAGSSGIKIPHTIYKVPPGRYEIKLGPIQGSAVGTTRVFDVDSMGREVRVSAMFDKGRIVTGRIVDEDGQPVHDAWVTDASGMLRASSGKEGRFKLTNCPQGAFQVRIRRSLKNASPSVDRQVSPGSGEQFLGDIVMP